MPDKSMDLTVTSPPYDNLRTYNGYVFDFENIAKELFRITKVGGVVVWVVGDGTINRSRTGTSMRQALFFMEIGFNLHQELYYEKSGPPPDQTRYEETIEKMYIFSSGKPKTINLIKDKKNRWHGVKQFGNKRTREVDGSLTEKKASVISEYGKRTSVWRYATGYGYSTKDKIAFQHPAIFPEALARDHILSWSNPGDIVFDPMMGSGTTGKMAVKLERNFIGIDISKEYFLIAEKRIKDAQAQPLLFEARGE
jgi:site-specific DNA-methyltransferase (adenine-specific)